MTSRPLTVALMLAVLVGTSACVSLPEQLKTVSAGHTGCAPEQLTIANIRPSGGGYLWNAACN